MTIAELKHELDALAAQARAAGYKIDTPSITADNVYGNKLAYYQHGGNKIVIHDHYMTNAPEAAVMNTLIHELAHAVAEQNNDTGKRVWHGDAWKAINSELGGDAQRYNQSGYTKPAPVKKTMAELFAIQPKQPASDWERGTFKQWLNRGYHVMKGQKGQLSVWTFVADEYELADQDGKTGKGGRASAVYFTPDQVEANKPRGDK